MIIVYMLQSFRDRMGLELSEVEAIHKQRARYFLGLRNRALNVRII